jgi:hypothetical protein
MLVHLLAWLLACLVMDWSITAVWLVGCRGAHVLVAVPEPSPRGQRHHAVAHGALASGRSGE